MNRRPLAMLAVATALVLAAAVPGRAAETTKGAEVGVWTQDFDAAKLLAKEKKLPLLLDFTGSDWCGWCKLMQSKVFVTEAFKAYAKTALVLVTIDFPRDQSKVPAEYRARNRQLQQQYGVRGYPTYVVLSSEGQQIGRLGADREATPEKFIGQVKDVIFFEPANLAAVAAGLDGAKKKAFEDQLKALEAQQAKLKELEQAFQAEIAPTLKTAQESYAAAQTAAEKKEVQQAFMTERNKLMQKYQPKIQAISAAIEKAKEALRAAK